MGRIRLEVCVDDAAGLAAACEGGADRIELCAALALGGLTPSAGLVALAAVAPKPVMAMIRPRSGDFWWSPTERQAMTVEIASMRQAGLAGVVIGASLPDGRLDAAALAEMIAAAEGLDVTLHRAIDLVPDVAQAMQLCRDLGIKRVLSSGGAVRGIDGIARLASMADYGVSVMPAGGVSAANAALFATALPTLSEIHASCSAQLPPATNAKVAAFGFQPESARGTDASLVRQLRATLDQIAARPAG